MRLRLALLVALALASSGCACCCPCPRPCEEPSGAPAPRPPAREQTKVLAVDNSANVVVIGVGSEDGVKVGGRFTVSRESHYVAEIEITAVEAKKAAGRADLATKAGPIHVGDDVEGYVAGDPSGDRLKFRLSPPRIIDRGEPPAGHLETRVLAVDDRANVFVIGVGREDGVKVGDRFTVSRDSHYVGEIDITEVEPKKAAGRANGATKAGPIRVGDDAGRP